MFHRVRVSAIPCSIMDSIDKRQPLFARAWASSWLLGQRQARLLTNTGLASGRQSVYLENTLNYGLSHTQDVSVLNFTFSQKIVLYYCITF